MIEDQASVDQAARQGRTSMRGLLVLNGALLIVLAAVTFGSTVSGQARGRGEYTMVAGGVPGSDANAIYIVDVANQEMIGMVYNPIAKGLDGVAYKNLQADAAAVSRGRNRPSP